MVFNSVTFVYYFLPAVIGVFFLLRKNVRLQNIWLVVASLFFYAWCNTKFLVFILTFGIANYCLSKILAGYADEKRSTWKKLILILGIGLNVLSLFIVKYLNFSIETANRVLNTSIPLIESMIVPLGISFLVFTMISYFLDVYWKKTKPLENVVDFFLYLSFFPKVSQGPIARTSQFQDELINRNISLADFCGGLRRFCYGLAKKVLIADILGTTVDLIFSSLPSGIPVVVAWMGMICYTFQIYFDFSGYTDMAIGIGAMFGFHLPENFNAPYCSKSVSEFWRRWHITLGAWFRDYIYIPLGGSRSGATRTYINLAVVWVLTGIWHGAAYNYILWGVGLGAIIMLEKAFEKKEWYIRIPSVIKWLGTFVTIMFSWVLFRSAGVKEAVKYLFAMFGVKGYANSAFKAQYFLDNSMYIALIAAILLTIPKPKKWCNWMKTTVAGTVIQNIYAIVLLMVALLFMVNSTYNAFIYFQF